MARKKQIVEPPQIDRRTFLKGTVAIVIAPIIPLPAIEMAGERIWLGDLIVRKGGKYYRATEENLRNEHELMVSVSNMEPDIVVDPKWVFRLKDGHRIH